MTSSPQPRDRAALIFIYGISALIFLVVAILGRLPEVETIPSYAPFLPRLNAIINTCCTLLLVTSWLCIRKGNVKAHKNLNITTFVLSSLFLISYVVYHSFGIEAKFPADHPLRPLYLGILLSHIVLAAVVLPLILFSFYYALTGRIDTHRKIVRFSFPVWLYVTSTGVVVYLMIAPYYKF